MANKSALLLGASGLVGSHLLEALLECQVYQEIRIITRRPINIKHPKLKCFIENFDNLDALQEVFVVDDLFCCLGTTLKQAKSKAAFRKVDYDYILSAAQLSKQQKVKRFLLLSSMGANPKSNNFYLRVKGETESALRNLNLDSLQIFRPSLLLGKRKQFRFAEAFFAAMTPLLAVFLKGALKRFRPVAAATVAQRMLSSAQVDKRPVSIIYF